MSQRTKRERRATRREARLAARRRARRRAWIIFAAVSLTVFGTALGLAIPSGELGFILGALIGVPAVAGIAAAIQSRLLQGDDAEDNDFYAAGNTWYS